MCFPHLSTNILSALLDAPQTTPTQTTSEELSREERAGLPSNSHQNCYFTAHEHSLQIESCLVGFVITCLFVVFQTLYLQVSKSHGPLTRD